MIHHPTSKHIYNFIKKNLVFKWNLLDCLNQTDSYRPPAGLLRRLLKFHQYTRKRIHLLV